MPSDAVRDLIGTKEAFHFSPERDMLFLKAMQRAFSFHYARCGPYRKLCDLRGFTPRALRRFEDIPSIPYLFVTIFKERKLTSVPDEKIALVLTSSGTTGQKSATYLDKVSLSRIRKIVWNIYESFQMADRKEKVNYLCFTYDPYVAKNLGTAFSDRLLTGLTSVNRAVYTITWREGEFSLDRDLCRRTLERFQKSPYPMRILGFPSFLYDVLEEAVRLRGKPFHFGERTFLITGGGWKTLGDKEVPKSLFREEVSRWLGIPPENIRDLLGMVEHGVPYCECERGNFHVPLYSRVYIRHPRDLRILPYGEPGIMHLVTPYLHSFPAISLLTTDVAVLHRECPCGRNGPYIELVGRGGVRKHRGCAIAALDVLEKSKEGGDPS
ncbi:MAG: acyl-protein synthetase [Candidatus Eremiobacteraeota bacterium]|nr:acyl-protein synthetase [Candidatus Eremiobacteraeota bacterium]